VNKPLLTTGAVLFGALMLAMPKPAAADIHVRVGGHVRFGTPRWSVGGYRPIYRPYYRPHYAIGGAIWVGGGGYYSGSEGYRTYAAPPPAPSCNCGPGAVPSYYPGYYSTGQNAYYAAPATPDLPRFGIGAYAGSFDANGEPGSDVGLMARLRLTDGLLLEGELGASETQSAHDFGLNPESRFGAALVYEIGARNTWAPYLIGGVGATKVDGAADSRGFGEIGVGLRWALTDNLHLGVDVRAGSKATDNAAYVPPGAAARVVTPTDPANDRESYTRARLSAMLYF
jgi:hypothetical protein